MSRPIVKFISEPPVLLNCIDFVPVQMEIYPRELGKCQVVLSVAAKSCSFDTGEKEFIHEMDVTDASEKVTVDIPLMMKCDEPLKYFILLSAHAINGGGHRSFTKRIETEVDGVLTLPPEDDPQNPPVV